MVREPFICCRCSVRLIHRWPLSLSYARTTAGELSLQIFLASSALREYNVAVESTQRRSREAGVYTVYSSIPISSQTQERLFMMLFISLNNNSVVLSIYPSLYRCKCLSLRPSIHSSIHPSIHYYSIHPFISQSIHCSIYLSFCSSLYRSFFPSVFLYVHSSIYRSIYRSIYLSFYLSFCRSIYHSIIMYACLSIHSFIHSSHRLWFIITFHSSIHFNSLSLHSNLNHN